ncbi:hypothetical protein AB0P05_26590 [Streptomyces flaveolus]|uniref:hypothetical protein n=1 Tax=Streptomyces flaveolus TaxID=67297 RepID=UPI003412BFC3
MANARFYSNTAQQTTLSGSISSGATAINVAATTGFPSSTPYTLALDYGAATEELVSVTGVAGTTLTVTRGYGGTSAQSHSLGAVVRHVVDATDLTDYRTHEAATAAVHGVTGTLVGTSDTQTLSNKTLTNPTVNSATVSGTVAGAHAYSGALTFSSSLTSSGGSLAGSWGGGPTFTGSPTFSATTNYSATQQSTLGATTGVAAAGIVSGDTFDRFRRYGDGKLEWGPGNAARDVNLYRSAADTLATDDSLSVGGSLSTTGDINVGTTNWVSFTPSWTGIGAVTFVRNVGWYKKIGKMVFVEIYAHFSSAGAGATGVAVNLPSTPFREGGGSANTTRQLITGWADAMAIMSPGFMYAPIFAGDVGTTTGTLRMYDQSQLQAQHIQANTIFTIEGWYREA